MLDVFSSELYAAEENYWTGRQLRGNHPKWSIGRERMENADEACEDTLGKSYPHTME